MRDKQNITCSFRPSKNELVKLNLTITPKFKEVSKADIDQELEEKHGRFFRIAHDRYQWESKL